MKVLPRQHSVRKLRKLYADKISEPDDERVRLYHEGRQLLEMQLLSAAGLTTGGAVVSAHVSGSPTQKISAQQAPAADTPGSLEPVMLLRIKSLLGAVNIIYVHHSDDIASAKSQLAEKLTDTPAVAIRLIYDGTELADSSTVGGCGLKSGDVVLMGKRRRQSVEALIAIADST